MYADNLHRYTCGILMYCATVVCWYTYVCTVRELCVIYLTLCNAWRWLGGGKSYTE